MMLRRLRRQLHWPLVAFLLAGSLMNLDDTVHIEQTHRYRYAFHSDPVAPELQIHPLHAEDSVVGRAFYLPAALYAYTIDDYELTVLPGTDLRLDIVRGFSQPSSITHADARITLTPEQFEALRAHTAAEGDDRYVGAYWIFVADGRKARHLIAFPTEHGRVIADEDLLEQVGVAVP